MVVVLKPLHDAAKIKRVVVSTYQAVSGTGKRAIAELESQVMAIYTAKEVTHSVYPHQIAFNCLPHIDVFTESGYTKEEIKMTNETVKIMEDPDIRVTATTVRVPVFYGHSESVNVEFERELTPDEARKILSKAPGVVVADNPKKNLYPLAIYAAGKDETFVGRIRKDESIACGLNMWIVADNIRKGAALNAVQIAEILAEKYLK
jgi:aspartate-semialdehyde dehydrogenase